jgi:peptide/nickel transport system permease protein
MIEQTKSTSTERGFLKDAVISFTRHRLALFGVTILLVVSVSSIFAPSIAPYDPNRTAVMDRLQPPSLDHWMGTDELGRDVLTRILFGGRISLAVGLATIAVSLAVGTSIGAIAGYLGGTLDNLLMRFTDVMISFPQIFVLIMLVSFLGQDLSTIVLVLGVVSWMPMARLVRAEFLSLKEKEFIMSARAIGLPGWRIVISHLLPNSGGPIIVAATLGVAAAIRSESGLSYLGLGLQPPTASWGTMLRNAQDQFLNAPWTAIFPGLMIFITVMAINFMGDGLRDALDPRSSRV